MPFFPGPVPRGFFLNGFSQWELPLRGFFRRPRVASALFPRPSPTGIFPAPTAPWDPPLQRLRNFSPPAALREFFLQATLRDFFPAGHPPGLLPPPVMSDQPPPRVLFHWVFYPQFSLAPEFVILIQGMVFLRFSNHQRSGWGCCTCGSPKGRDPSTLSLPRPALQSFLPHALQVFLLANLVPAFSVFLPGGVDRGQVAASLHTSLE